jgi:hypothetical protein
MAVRGVACLALWPAATTLSDAGGYAVHAAGNPLTDPQHPAGYAALLALLGLVSRDIAVTVLLQHALGIAAAVLLFATVRRLTGSPWPALIPAAVVLLDTDEIFLEHNVMSEGPFLFVLAGGLYAAVRSADTHGQASYRWAALAGITIAAAAMVRSAGLVALPIVALAMALNRPPGHGRWHAPASFLAVACALLAGCGALNLAASGRFELTPATGWHLYARVGRFADCRRFTPPPGTRGLCESVPPAARGWGPDFYLYTPGSPGRRLFGHIGSHDGALAAFAFQAILHQPADFVGAVWIDVRRYFVPSLRPHGWYIGWDLDPQLQWNRSPGHAFTRDVHTQLVRFFDPFVPRRNGQLLAVLSDYGRVFGFGAVLLTLCTLLTLAGLFVGPRPCRAGVLLLGGGGLVQLLVPTVSVLYMGRYLVPVAGLIAGSAAISVHGILRAHAQSTQGPVALPIRLRENGSGDGA